MNRLLLPLFLAAACQSVEEPPTFDAGVQYLTQYNYRGAPMNDEGAFQVDAGGACALDDGSHIHAHLLTIWDASDDVGKAKRVGGQGGEVTEVRGQAVWRKTYGLTTVTAGAVIYDYPGRVRPATTELILGVGWESTGWKTDLTLYHDVDAIEGSYLDATVRRRFPLGEQLHVDVEGGVGLTDGDHGLANYGVSDGGSADVRAIATLGYELDRHTTLTATLGTSTFLRNDFDRALGAVGVDSDNIWFGFGATWGF